MAVETEITKEELEVIFQAIDKVLEPYDKLKGYKLMEIRFEEAQQEAVDQPTPSPTPTAQPQCKCCKRGKGCITEPCPCS